MIPVIRWIDVARIAAGILAAGLLSQPGGASAALTYYVALGGDDSRNADQATNQATPWATIGRALSSALGGDTINVLPGTYPESVESKRDGLASAPIVLQSTVVGGAIIQPPADPGSGAPVSPGFFISHNYHAILGFKVTGSTIGLRLGAHDNGDGPVSGLVIRNNEVYNNTNNGIQVSNGIAAEIAFNNVHDNGTGTQGGSGITYDGSSGSIHDNVVRHNSKKGVWIKSGAGHLVYDNFSTANVQQNLLIDPSASLLPTPAEAYYVDCLTGDDSRTPTDAKNPATPWKTIKNALVWADGGDTVMVEGGTVQLPRTCQEAVESRTAGSAGAPITIKAATPGSVIVDPPSGSGLNGFFITHAYHTIDGFIVTGATSGNGIQVQGDGTTAGIVITGNQVFANNQVGIKVVSAGGVSITHNIIHHNLHEGIIYKDGTRANIFNNLVYTNGIGIDGGFGIEISSGNGHKVINNTVYQNFTGGIRLGTSTGTPVYSTVVNNIVVDNHTGIKEPALTGYQGIAKLEFNNVVSNSLGNYDLSPTGSVVGSSSISQDPAFVSIDPSSPSFLKLSRIASGQSVNSPCIDKGSTAADTLGLGTRSPFTDAAPDAGRVDLGFHWLAQ
jgi:hypothetical protein